MEPWNQEEMPVSEELARQAAEQSDLRLWFSAEPQEKTRIIVLRKAVIC